MGMQKRLSAGEEVQQDRGNPDFEDEEMQSDTPAETTKGSGHENNVLSCATRYAEKRPSEDWDQEPFKRKKGIDNCMLELDNKGIYGAAYFLQWSASEVKLRVPVQGEEDYDEWVNLQSSRLWRGPVSHHAWAHIGKGKWRPKGGKKKAKKYKKQADPEGGKRTGKAKAVQTEPLGLNARLHGTQQASLNTFSHSHATLDSGSREFVCRASDADGPEISSGGEGTESGGKADRPQQRNNDAAQGGSKQEEFNRYFAEWQKGHLRLLAERQQLNLPIAENCNWESGNLKALQVQPEGKGGHASQSFAHPEQNMSALPASLRQRHKGSKEDSHGHQKGPRSPSPSTPHKPSHEFRRQHSSSEDAEPGTILHASKLEAKQNHNNVSGQAHSPRSIGNLRPDHKISGGWKKHDALHERNSVQNSGSSSSSGRVPDESPNTVLPNGTDHQQPGTKRLKPGVPLEKLQNGSHDANFAACLPLKKRIKLALVETDPFAAA